MSNVLENEEVKTLMESAYQNGVKDGLLQTKEICICAAVKSTTGMVVRAHRHGDCIYLMVTGRVYEDGKQLTPSKKLEDQGFITSKNRYVTREEGRKLQDAAGIPSASPDGYRGKTLFSEDLY